MKDYTVRPAREEEVSKEFTWNSNYFLEDGDDTETDYSECEMGFFEYAKEE